MLRYRKNRRLSERMGSRPYRKARGYRRLNESAISDLQITTDEFYYLPFKKQFELIEQFCKDNDKVYTVVLDSSDYLNPDGSVNDEEFNLYEHEELMDVEAEIAEAILPEFVDGESNSDALGTLFSIVSQLEIPYDGRQNFFLVYDEQGKAWPKPPKNY